MVGDPWTMVDPLGDALRILRMSGVFYCRSEFTAPWGLALPPFDHSMMFHVVTEGRCSVEIDGVDSCVLQPGTVALIPHGEGHCLIGDPGVAPIDLVDASRELLSPRYEVLRHGGGGAQTSMLCGLVHFDHPAAGDLLRLLPRVICHNVTSPQAEWIHSTLRVVAAEAQALQVGGEALITRLADILVLETVRSWLARNPDRVGWLGALRDKQIGHALTLIHREPGRDWTLGALATAVAMSRSAFAARFTALVGAPVMRYVTRWKMHAAELSLREERTALSDIADRLGYSSEAAFSRAFKRVTGRSPGSIKRQEDVSTLRL
jgi:AraC-like DNA-binding protein